MTIADHAVQKPARPTPSTAIVPPIQIVDDSYTQRARRLLLTLGPPALTSAELLTLLTAATRNKADACGVGHRLLAHAHGSLRRLAVEPYAALADVSGVGPMRAAAVLATFEIGRRYALECRGDQPPIGTPADIYKHFRVRLEDLPVEEFHVGILTPRHTIERDVTVTCGLLNSSPVHPREVFRDVLHCGAAHVVLVHNHPSGDPTPSPEDRVITDQLVSAGLLLDIRVVDHVIIGRGRYTSFLESGWL